MFLEHSVSWSGCRFSAPGAKFHFSWKIIKKMEFHARIQIFVKNDLRKMRHWFFFQWKPRVHTFRRLNFQRSVTQCGRYFSVKSASIFHKKLDFLKNRFWALLGRFFDFIIKMNKWIERESIFFLPITNLVWFKSAPRSLSI